MSPKDVVEKETPNCTVLYHRQKVRQRIGYELLLARDLKLLHRNDYETMSQQTVEIKRGI
jgi:hypothetical protein